jgi:hypothetical protein
MRRWASLGLFLVVASTAVWAEQASSAAVDRLLQASPGVQLRFDGDRLTRVFGAPLAGGRSPEASADAFVHAHSDVFGISPDELVPGNTFNGQYTQPVMYEPETGTYKFTLVYYSQYTGGLPVFRGGLRLLVKNEAGYPVVWAGSSLRTLGTFNVPAGAATSVAEGAAHAMATREAPGLVNFTPAEVAVWAGEDNLDVSPSVAITFVADNGLAATPDYQKFLFIADAATGRILYKEDQIVHTDVTGNVQGMATDRDPPKADACNPENSLAMKWARVSIGSTVAYTDGDGNFTIPNAGETPVAVSSPIAGRYFVVQNQGGANTVLTITVTPPGPAYFLHNEMNSIEFNRAEVNGYVQANVVRDWLLAINPTYPTINNQLNFTVNVNLNQTCNAFYDGSSINFYRLGGGCNNTAFSGVVHHEYGHHIVQVAGSGQGEYGEGMGDCMGVLISDTSKCAVGFNTSSCTNGIRDANNNCQYSASSCSSCGSEIHACGQLISGCVWSTRNALAANYPTTYLQILSNLTVNSVLLHTGTAINADIAVDFLTLDDDDGNIGNGTPHYNEICAGFGAHGIACPPLALLSFSYPNGRPALTNPAGGVAFRVEVAGITGQPQPDTGVLYYKVGTGAWNNTPLQVVSPNVYDAVFPAVPCGSKVSYYVSARTTINQVVTDPAGAPTSFFAAHSGYATNTVFAFDFEAATDEGWARGDTGDTATTGLWDRADPEPTPAQPGDDHTPPPGVKCWVTDHRAGNSIGDWDVDGGKTTVKSPVFDLSTYGNATIGYWRWYSNDQGGSPNADTFRVDVSNNGGTSWVNAETVGPTGPETGGGWYYHEFDVTDKVPMSAQIRLRFVAEDAGSGSIIEAALDDFAIAVVDCTPPAATGDMNCDGVVNFDDIDPFVLALSDPNAYQTSYPNCNLLNGDCNHDGAVNFDDIDAFVALLGT